MDINGYVTFLVIGLVLVIIDGQIVYRSGRALLEDAYPDSRGSRSMMQLVTVLFYLVVLGVLALVSTIDVNTGHPVQDVVVKLGVVLLVLAGAHAVTVLIVSRVRDRRHDDYVTDELVEQGNAVPRPSVSPAGESHLGRKPTVSQPIDRRGPYSSPR